VRPVSSEYEVSQDFGSYATAGVVGNAYGNEVQQLVAMYGNYQPFGHAGQDIATPIGTPVVAISDGTVLWAGWGEDLPGDESWGPSGYFQRWALYKTFPGICTVIQHWWGISVTAHMSDAPLNVGDKVTEGQQIGLTGNTKARGQAVGAHVHIEALIDLSYTTGGGLIYGRTDPTQFYGGLAAQGSATQEEDMANVSDDQLGRLLRAADRVNGVITDEHAKVLTTNDIDDIANKVLETLVPLAGGGTTDLKTKVTYQKQEFNVIGAKIDALATAVATMVSAQPGVTISSDEILGQIDNTLRDVLAKGAAE
jgi:hypothetical protein